MTIFKLRSNRSAPPTTTRCGFISSRRRHTRCSRDCSSDVCSSDLPQGKVSFTFELTTPACPVRDRFKTQAQDLVGDLPGVKEVAVRMTANVRPAFMRPKPSEILPGVKQTIAVASGKGGVGKST